MMIWKLSWKLFLYLDWGVWPARPNEWFMFPHLWIDFRKVFYLSFNTIFKILFRGFILQNQILCTRLCSTAYILNIFGFFISERKKFVRNYVYQRGTTSQEASRRVQLFNVIAWFIGLLGAGKVQVHCSPQTTNCWIRKEKDRGSKLYFPQHKLFGAHPRNLKTSFGAPAQAPLSYQTSSTQLWKRISGSMPPGSMIERMIPDQLSMGVCTDSPWREYYPEESPGEKAVSILRRSCTPPT